MNDDLTKRALLQVERIADPASLRQIAKNAAAQGNDAVREAALKKLFSVSPEAEPGTLEHDVWRSIHALEEALSDERGRTTRLSRTRQKITKDGEMQTVIDLVRKPPSEGYKMLIDRGWPELTFEAVSLRHEDRFDQDTLQLAKGRLQEIGVDIG